MAAMKSMLYICLYGGAGYLALKSLEKSPDSYIKYLPGNKMALPTDDEGKGTCTEVIKKAIDGSLDPIEASQKRREVLLAQHGFIHRSIIEKEKLEAEAQLQNTSNSEKTSWDVKICIYFLKAICLYV